jgi:hypothetical protein
MRLDHRSGVSYYLLDADGHRRHGHVGDDTSSGTGFFAVARPSASDFSSSGDSHGRWAFHYRLPCRFVFEGKEEGRQSLILVSGGQDSQVRMRYTFDEDRVVATLVPPTDPRAEYEMWLGDFDVLGTPLLNPSGTVRKGKETGVISEGVFFPHAVHRQGLLVTLPEKRPFFCQNNAVHFPVRVGQDVVVRFAAESEVPGSFTNARAPKAPRPAP